MDSIKQLSNNELFDELLSRMTLGEAISIFLKDVSKEDAEKILNTAFKNVKNRNIKYLK